MPADWINVPSSLVPGPQPLPRASEIKIAVLSDSVSAQSPLIDETWPSVLARNLHQGGVPCNVQTFAINGWTAFRTMNTAVYGSRTTYQACVDARPNVVIVCLGFNECFGNPDARDAATVTGDIQTLLTNLRAALPNALIYFADQGVYDSGNFTSTTILNKGLPPQVWTLRSSGILLNSYSSEILDDAASTSVKASVSAWDGYVTAARASVALTGWFSIKSWYLGRLGFTTSDRLHPTRLGQALVAGAVLKGLRASAAMGVLAPFYGDQQKPSWIDPDVVFTDNLTGSGNGYISKVPTAGEAEAALRHWAQASRELHPDSWFHPYKAKVNFKPVTGPTGSSISIASGLYNLRIQGAVPLSQVGMSIDGGAFVAIGESTNEAGDLRTVGNMAALATTLSTTAGTRVLRIGIGISSFGPQTLTLTA